MSEMKDGGPTAHPYTAEDFARRKARLVEIAGEHRDSIDPAIFAALTIAARATSLVPRLRCDVTQNLIGTDTEMIGAPPCPCQGHSVHRAITGEPNG